MIVVADTSPLVVLVNVRLIDILPALFHRVVIPPEVLGELLSLRKHPPVQKYYSLRHEWLEVRTPSARIDIPRLDAGESAAISLALELKPDLLLIDERLGFIEAVSRKIPAVGTVRILELAAERHLVDLREAHERLKQSDFWISHHLLDQRLEMFIRKQGGPR